MRDYGKVHSSFWSSQTIRSMSDDARTLAIYLMTSSHTTISGTFRLPDGYISEDLGWNGSERVSEGFRELFAKGFANRCETTKWVWIRKHFKWNPPENPNQRKAALKVVNTIPDDCCWKVDFIEEFGDCLGISRNPFETVSEPFRNQKQEQKQKQNKEQVQEGSSETPAQPSKTRGSRLPDDWVPSEEDISWAKSERPDLDIRREAASFRDYWIGVAGAKGAKLDWPATWRNWIRKANAPYRSQQPTANPRPARRQLSDNFPELKTHDR